MATVRAVKTFATGSRVVSKGTETQLSDSHAEELERRGVVEIMTDKGPDETKPEGPEERKVVSEENMSYHCPLCDYRTDTQRGLTVHQTAKHK